MRYILCYAQELTTIYELGKFNLILIYSGLLRLVAAKKEIDEQLLL
jgi:hypothetical protein